MSAPGSPVGVQVKVDFDVRTWVQIPPPPTTPEEFGARTVRLWAADGAWTPRRRRARALERWYAELATVSRALDPVMGLVHVRPDDPSPLLGVDLFLHEMGPDELPSPAESVVGEDTPGTRRSEPAAVEVGNGPPGWEGRRWTTAPGGAVVADYRLAWQAHPLARLMLRARDGDLARVERAVDDIRALARATWFEPLDEQL